jgi:RNA polymerase sigma-70 factor (ECF subfamily)
MREPLVVGSTVVGNLRDGSGVESCDERRSREGPPMARVNEDLDLVLRSKKGEISAFGELVERYQSLVINFCYKMLGNREDAEDIAQETFLRAFAAIGRFQPRAKFSTWLLTIAKNLALNLIRSERRRLKGVDLVGSSEDAQQAVDLAASDNPGPDRVAMQEERAQYVRRALKELSDTHRTIIVLRDFEGVTYEEIARIMGCRKGTVKSRLSRAREHLKQILMSCEASDLFG